MHHTWDYQHLSEACNQEGCILCRVAAEQITRYLQAWKDELFTDVDVREELRRSRGFCNTHTWQLAQMGASLPLAQAYRDVLSDAAEQLSLAQNTETHRQGRLQSRFRRSRPGQQSCPACQRQEQTLARLAIALRQALLDPPFYTRFSASAGLCLPHFQLSGELQPREKHAQWLPLLRQAQLTCLRRLDAQLAELIRKHDYRFKDEAPGDEMRSWRRAAGLVAGEDERKIP